MSQTTAVQTQTHWNEIRQHVRAEELFNLLDHIFSSRIRLVRCVAVLRQASCNEKDILSTSSSSATSRHAYTRMHYYNMILQHT